MSSQTEICNLALTRLAKARITSIDDEVSQAADMKAIYNMAAKQVMALGDWPSCRRRASLAQTVATPEFEYDYQYALPTDPKCLVVRKINECRTGDIKHSIEGNFLLTNADSAKIKYTAFITDTEAYDIWLEQAIVDRLVAEIIYKTTGQQNLFRDALKYHLEHAKALLSDAGQQDPAEDINSDTYLDARL